MQLLLPCKTKLRKRYVTFGTSNWLKCASFRWDGAPDPKELTSTAHPWWHLRLTPLRPRLTPLRPRLSPLRPRLTPLRPRLTLLRPRLTPLRPRLTPLRPRLNPLRPRLNPLRPRLIQLRPRLISLRPRLIPHRLTPQALLTLLVAPLGWTTTSK